MSTMEKTDKIEDILKNLDDLLRATTLKAVDELQKVIDAEIKKSGDGLKQLIKTNPEKIDEIEIILKSIYDLLQAKKVKAVEELQKAIDAEIKKLCDKLKQLIKTNPEEELQKAIDAEIKKFGDELKQALIEIYLIKEGNMSTTEKTDKIEDILKNLDDLLRATTLKAVDDLQKVIDAEIKKSGDELKQLINKNCEEKQTTDSEQGET